MMLYLLSWLQAFGYGLLRWTRPMRAQVSWERHHPEEDNGTI